MKMKRYLRWSCLGLLAFTIAVLSLPATSFAGVGIGISVGVAPPALPVYEQPVCPGPGHLWTPGYWAWNEDGGYYWVPGTWVVAPVGMLWTPGYWGHEHGRYGWHAGYWGPHVGFYGGVNYGFGYGGVGFEGGEWRGGAFFYNRAVLNINVGSMRNVYSRNVIVNNVHMSFNGPGGIMVRPNREEERFSREPHRMALREQMHHEHEAGRNRELFASHNHGHPGIAATGRPGEFSHAHVARASEAREMHRDNHGSDHLARNDRHVNDRHADNHRVNDGHANDHHVESHHNDRPAARAENHDKHGGRER
jgi:hypothetical protein